MTSLQVWFANAASSTLSTANQLYASSGGSPATNATYSNFGTGTGFIEITSQGQVGTCVGSIGSPSGKGFLWDVTTLEAQQFLSGNWSAVVRLNASQFVQATSTGLTQAGTLTADIYVRAYRRSSAGVYTQLVSMVLTGQSITSAFTSYSLPSTSAAASATFATGDKLYVDIWCNITANANANANQGVRLNRLTTDTTTFVGDTAATVVTPGYQSGATNFNTTITEQLLTFSAEATTTSATNITTTITEQLTSFSANASASGSQSQANQLTSFSAEATSSGEFGYPTTPGVSVLLGNSPPTAVMIREGSFEIDDSINAMSTCSFTVRDDSGTNHYQKGEQVAVNDHHYGLMFTGNLNNVEEQNVWPNDLIFSKADAQDNHYYPMKRTYIGDEYENQYAGAIATDLLNVLTVEGITAQYASRRETTQAQFALGTLSGVEATEEGLQLAPAGLDVTIVDDFTTGTKTNTQVSADGLVSSSVNAIKLSGTMNVPGISNAAAFYKIWTGPYTIGSNDGLEFFLWVDRASPEIKATVDVVCTDGSRLQDQASLAYSDYNALRPTPQSDLAGYADGQWYLRVMRIGPAGFSGKIISYVAVALGGQKTGDYTAYFRQINIVDLTTNATKSAIFNGTLSIAPQQLQTTGYKNVALSVVPTYDLQTYQAVGFPDTPPNYTTAPAQTSIHQRVSTTYSLDGAILLKNSVMSWQASEPDHTKLAIRVALDNGTPVECVNNAPLPNLVPGMNLTGRSLTIYQDFYLLDGTSPEITPLLNSLEITIQSAPTATKTDASYTTTFLAGESGAAFSSTIGNSGILNLTGATRDWDLPIGHRNYDTDQPAFLGTAGDTIFQRAYEFGSPSAGNESKTRFDFSGQHQNFIAEIDVQLQSDISIGLVYRSTNFSSNNGSYAYAVFLSETGMSLKKGTNTTGGGAATTLQSVSFTLQDNSWHRIKAVVNGSSHSIYLDDVLQFTKSDSSFGATGYLGVIGVSPTQAYPQFNFDNFGMVDALSGTWTSPNIPLNSVANYGNSYIDWRDRSESPSSNNALTVEYTINGGSTWVSCTKGAALPGLTSGQSLTGINLKIRVTLTTTTAQSMPGLDNLYVLVIGAYSASGSRVSLSLPLLNVGRLGNSLFAWNSILPPGCTLGADTSINGGGTWTDVSSQNGESIPDLSVQPDPWLDTFDDDTSADYTAVNGTWDFDTAHSRINVTATTLSFLIYGAQTVTDVDVQMHTDDSDLAGLVWRYSDTSNYYDMVVQDGSSGGGSANTVAIFKVSSGIRTQLASVSISFTRGTFKLFKVTMLSGVITVYMDGDQILTYTDGSPLSSGTCGLRSDVGSAHIYQLRIQPLGQDVTAVSVQTRFRLTSTNPAYTPQVLDATLAAYGNTISKGALIPVTQYNFKYLSDCFDDLVKQSAAATGNQWWWYIDKNKKFYMLPQTGMPAPWIASDNPGDFLIGVKVTDLSDLYRNRQIIKNVIATVAIDDSRTGDGFTRNWTLDYALASAPTITINGIVATVGIKGESGKDFYYAIGDPVIAQDSSGAILVSTQTIRFVGTGQYTTYSQYDDLVEQAAFKLIEGGSGIVENVEDGNGISKDAGDQLAQARVKQYGLRGKKLEAKTRRYGLAPGQILSVFLSRYGLRDAQFLIRNVKTTLTTEYDPDQGAMIQHGWYDIEAVSGADEGEWIKLFQRDQ